MKAPEPDVECDSGGTPIVAPPSYVNDSAVRQPACIVLEDEAPRPPRLIGPKCCGFYVAELQEPIVLHYLSYASARG